jgi:hypothetical protein
MIAWMRAWSRYTQPPPPETAPSPCAIPSCSIDIRTQLALILAGIMLGQPPEARRQ